MATYRIFGDGSGYYEAWKRDGLTVTKIDDSCDVLDMYKAILKDAGIGGDEIIRDPVSDEDEPTDFGVKAEDFGSVGNVYVRPECIFHYCPTVGLCRGADRCQSPMKTAIRD
jgi:hypothetical protein